VVIQLPKKTLKGKPASLTWSRYTISHFPVDDGPRVSIPIVFREFKGYPQFQRITINGLNWVACPNFKHTQCPNINLWNVVGLYPLRDIVHTKKILML
jgi:hypothetical protein